MTTWLSLLMVPALAGALPVDVTHQTLDNGLRIYLAPMDTPGIVAVQTWVDAGSGSEVLPGTTGHAHFLEHLLFTDTTLWPATERDQLLRTTGTRENAWTWLDDTVYHQILPAETLPALLRYEAERFQHVVLADPSVQREAGAVQGEWRQSQSWPSEALIDGLYAAAFPAHPYGHSTLGTDEDVAAMPDAGALVRDFKATWYRPSTIRLVVVGDFDPDATLAALGELWGDWAEPTQPLPEIPAQPAQLAPVSLEIPWDDPGTNPWAAVGWRVPARHPADPDSAALAILDELLLSDIAPFRRALLEVDPIAHDLGGKGWRFRDPHLFMVYVELYPDVPQQAFFEALDAQLEAIRQGVDPELLAAVKARSSKAFQLGLDDPQRMAGVIGRATAVDPDPRALDGWMAALQAVTPQDLSGVVETYFVPQGRTQVVLAPPEAP